MSKLNLFAAAIAIAFMFTSTAEARWFRCWRCCGHRVVKIKRYHHKGGRYYHKSVEVKRGWGDPPAIEKNYQPQTKAPQVDK